MNINLRIKEVRKTLSLSQEEFGSRLGITGGGVSKIEKGVRNVTDQMVLAICREFNVNKIWLIEGHGEMFEDDDMEFARAVNRVMFGESEFARKVFKLFGKLSLEEWNKLEEIARSLVDDKKKEADE